MEARSSTIDDFLSRLEAWFQEKSEILILFRYSHAAGSKDFKFFYSSQEIAEALRQLPSLTSVIAFKQPQLLIRGIVDDEFISQCLEKIPNGCEFLILGFEPVNYGRMSWLPWAVGESHLTLRDELQDLKGCSVAAGAYPSWMDDNESVMSTIVPNEKGVATGGVY